MVIKLYRPDGYLVVYHDCTNLVISMACFIQFTGLNELGMTINVKSSLPWSIEEVQVGN